MDDSYCLQMCIFTMLTFCQTYDNWKMIYSIPPDLLYLQTLMNVLPTRVKMVELVQMASTAIRVLVFRDTATLNVAQVSNTLMGCFFPRFDVQLMQSVCDSGFSFSWLV